MTDREHMMKVISEMDNEEYGRLEELFKLIETLSDFQCRVALGGFMALVPDKMLPDIKEAIEEIKGMPTQ